MADDQQYAAKSPSTTTAKSDSLPKKFPKGVVLGRDGKPCRSCTSFASWAAQAKSARNTTISPSSSTSTSASSSATLFDTALGNATASSPPSSDAPSFPSPPPDCPPDVDALGRATWSLLHSISATYPTVPSSSEQSTLRTFMTSFAKLYPCWVCAEDFQAYMAREQIRVGSRDEFGKWLCEAHNDVNVKLGKERFDCARWEERWRTGWKDGRCDQ